MTSKFCEAFVSEFGDITAAEQDFITELEKRFPGIPFDTVLDAYMEAFAIHIAPEDYTTRNKVFEDATAELIRQTLL